jgi:hypothetical protein
VLKKKVGSWFPVDQGRIDPYPFFFHNRFCEF